MPITNGADLNEKDKDGWTALRYAAIQKRCDIALLKKTKDKK